MADKMPITGTVLRTEQLTRNMIRVVLGGAGLRAFVPVSATDQYIKLLFPTSDAERPRRRTYTVRRWDSEAVELWIDVAVHGDRGLAAPWALRAAPGDAIQFLGPGGGYFPDPEADWHLLAGDESALPAIAAALEAMPAEAIAMVFVEVDGPEDETPLRTNAHTAITWVHRRDLPVGDALVKAVRSQEVLPGDVQVFVHGEAGFVKELRGYLRVERQVERTRLSVSGYWRQGKDDEGWRASKRAWNEAVEAEQEQRLPQASR
ncbi:siderophore-interacting protein [Kutzneria sp. CA-103260]|uniref:siderophore-interacting protein n=1 Tax=Kutzneria sp. CA-103260 TaxID=2802641 RepID=UPI001BAC6434|nr:siderophore-interacting protein [Kutzneria sp. CA-103260]QUQ67503.1 siderophore-interacting protein [Kutzneria sp. CA-103260]